MSFRLEMSSRELSSYAPPPKTLTNINRFIRSKSRQCVKGDVPNMCKLLINSVNVLFLHFLSYLVDILARKSRYVVIFSMVFS